MADAILPSADFLGSAPRATVRLTVTSCSQCVGLPGGALTIRRGGVRVQPLMVFQSIPRSKAPAAR
jgi:hypothetical protein